MQSNRKQKNENRGSWFGWLIFFVVVAGGPILNAIQGALGPGVRLPNFLLPLIVMALVVISAVISIARAMGAGSGDPGPINRMPTSAPPRERPINYPMPPVSGDMGMPMWPIPTSSGTPQPSHMPSGNEKLPEPPRFEPIITPRIGLVGVAGLFALAALAAVVLGGQP